MINKIDLIKLTNHISTGTVYTDCVVCGGIKKLGITKSVDSIIYQCFRQSCNTKGKFQLRANKEVLSSILNKKLIQESLEFRVPEYLVSGFSSPDSLKMALKYNLLHGYTKGLFNTAFDPKLNRQVFYYLNSDGKVVGCMGRALHSSVKPKAYIYPQSEKTPWIIGDYSEAVVVEDIFSAVNVWNAGFTGIALSGTTLESKYLPLFEKYDKIYVCLDKDATTKSLNLAAKLTIVSNHIVTCLLTKDFKDSTIDEIRRRLL